MSSMVFSLLWLMVSFVQGSDVAVELRASGRDGFEWSASRWPLLRLLPRFLAF